MTSDRAYRRVWGGWCASVPCPIGGVHYPKTLIGHLAGKHAISLYLDVSDDGDVDATCICGEEFDSMQKLYTHVANWTPEHFLHKVLP